MPSVRAKFRVSEKTEHSFGTVPMVTVKLEPVMPVYKDGKPDPSEENTRFWQASPSGEMRLGCINKAAADAMPLGQVFYVDFTPAT